MERVKRMHMLSTRLIRKLPLNLLSLALLQARIAIVASRQTTINFLQLSARGRERALHELKLLTAGLCNSRQASKPRIRAICSWELAVLVVRPESVQEK